MNRTTTARKARFAELYESHLEAIVNYLERRASHTDAVDVAAQTFATAWRRLEDVPAGAELPWLYGVAGRTLANHRRGNVRRTALHDKLVSEWEGSSEPTQLADTMLPLRDALDSLSEEDRNILLLAGVEELKPAEIAVVLDVSPEVARNRLSRARTRLRAALPSTDEGAE